MAMRSFFFRSLYFESEQEFPDSTDVVGDLRNPIFAMPPPLSVVGEDKVEPSMELNMA